MKSLIHEVLQGRINYKIIRCVPLTIKGYSDFLPFNIVINGKGTVVADNHG